MPRSRSRRQIKHRHRKRHPNALATDRMFDKAVDAALKVTAPKVLYHYTTWSGVEGILKSQRFWATAHDCTNDEAELRSADAAIMEVATELRKNAKGTATAVLDLFLEKYPRLQISELTTVYLSCFSVARDDKEQWRKYADDGRGVCLGIHMLEEPGPKLTDRGSAIVKVDYSESSWRATLSENLTKICAVMEKATVTKKNMELGLFALHRIAAFAAIGAKQEKWAAEQEYRHVTLPHKEANVHPEKRVSGGQTIRFLPTMVRGEGKKIALAEIIIGLNQNVGEARQRLNQLLVDAGYSVDEMEYPKIMPSAVGTWCPAPEPPI